MGADQILEPRPGKRQPGRLLSGSSWFLFLYTHEVKLTLEHGHLVLEPWLKRLHELLLPINQRLLRRGEPQDVFATITRDRHSLSRYEQRFCLHEGLQVEVFLLLG